MKIIKTKKNRIVNGKALIVTVDISKDRHFGYWRCPDGTDVKPFSFLNNGAGFTEFWERISRAKEIHHLDEIVFGYESTGPLRSPRLACRLAISSGITVNLLQRTALYPIGFSSVRELYL